MKRVLLIDGDVLVYRVAFAAEQAVDWGDDVFTLTADAAEAKATMDFTIRGFMDTLDASDYVVCLTPSKELTFRQYLWPAYKQPRQEKRRPMVYGALREHLTDAHAAKMKPGLEADDIMGIMATNDAQWKGSEKIIVSLDKDMRTIPGLLYDFTTLHTVTEAEADHRHMLQALTGDRVDNYPGCPGIGDKRAERILDEAGEAPWPAIVAAFEKAKLTAEDALLQARLARILRADDFNFKTGEPILWTP